MRDWLLPFRHFESELTFLARVRQASSYSGEIFLLSILKEAGREGQSYINRPQNMTKDARVLAETLQSRSVAVKDQVQRQHLESLLPKGTGIF